MTIHDFIKKRKCLIWWVKDYDKLGPESIVEATLNYGDWDDVQTLIKIMGIKEVARIFREKSQPSKEELFGAHFNEKLFRVQLTYLDDVNYDEEVEYLPGFAASDDVIKKALIEFGLK